MIKSGGFLTDITGLDNFVNFPFKILESYSKELSNIKKHNNKKNNLYIDAGLNIIGKKIIEKFGSGITLINNEM